MEVAYLQNTRPRILLLIDRKEWALHHIAKAIIANLSHRFSFEIVEATEHPEIDFSKYDLMHIFYFGDHTYDSQIPPNLPVMRSVYSERWQIDGLSADDLYRKHIRGSKAVLAPSERIFKLLSTIPIPIYLCPEGVDTNLFHPGPNRIGPIVAGWAGNPSDPIKQVHISREACAGLCDLRITDGSLTANEMVDFYHSIDILLCSSKAEGCPRTLLEAMACGRFPITFPVGITREIIRHKQNGYIVEHRTVEELREAIRWCQSHTNVLRTAEKTAPQEIRNKRDWSRTIGALERVYDQVLGTATPVIPTSLPTKVPDSDYSQIPQWLRKTLYAIWKAGGKPMPRLARHMRYKWLVRWWPVQNESQFDSQLRNEVAVIIPCHNYGKYLAQAIEGALAQTVKPTEILVADDASEDDTAQIAARYADQGVEYVRFEHRNVSHTRNEAAKFISSPFVMFLDADDYLPKEYLERCLAQITSPKVAVVYADRQHIGQETTYIKSGEYSYERLSKGNFISSHALIRRQAFDLVGGYRDLTYNNSHADWDLYRRILRMPFTAKHAETFVYYRVHNESMLQKHLRSPQYTYINDAALLKNPLTIFTPFAGRWDVLGKYLSGIKSMNMDPQYIHLHWYITCSDKTFLEQLRTVSSQLPFARVTVTHAPLPDNWKHTPQTLIQERFSDNESNIEYYYQLAVIRAYHELIRTCDTDYALTVEDDIQLSADTIPKLLQAMESDVAAVVAPYRSGFYPRYEVWVREGEKKNLFRERGNGIQQIDGAGMGCTLFRVSALRKSAPLYTAVREKPKQWYDQILYRRIAQYGKILCNWDAEVEHLQTNRYVKSLSLHYL